MSVNLKLYSLLLAKMVVCLGVVVHHLLLDSLNLSAANLRLLVALQVGASFFIIGLVAFLVWWVLLLRWGWCFVFVKNASWRYFSQFSWCLLLARQCVFNFNLLVYSTNFLAVLFTYCLSFLRWRPLRVLVGWNDHAGPISLFVLRVYRKWPSLRNLFVWFNALNFAHGWLMLLLRFLTLSWRSCWLDLVIMLRCLL